MENYSATQKNTAMPLAATWMDQEMIILSEVSQVGEDKFHMSYNLCDILIAGK